MQHARPRPPARPARPSGMKGLNEDPSPPSPSLPLIPTLARAARQKRETVEERCIVKAFPALHCTSLASSALLGFRAGDCAIAAGGRRKEGRKEQECHKSVRCTMEGRTEEQEPNQTGRHFISPKIQSENWSQLFLTLEVKISRTSRHSILNPIKNPTEFPPTSEVNILRKKILIAACEVDGKL